MLNHVMVGTNDNDACDLTPPCGTPIPAGRLAKWMRSFCRSSDAGS